MKILLLFCDMLRANRLSVFNPSLSVDKPMDDWMKKLGGTAYRNCYSPAPDTPRSLACLYTGLYPKQHGCKKRIHWPKYYLDPVVENIFRFLQERKFALFANFSALDLCSGILPDGMIEAFVNEETLHQLTRHAGKIVSSRDAMVFVNLPDYHHVVSDNGGASVSDKKGNDLLANSFEIFFSHVSPDEFDYIFIFSDHGCKLNDDAGLGERISLLNDDRSKIVMFLHKKGDSGVKFVDGLTSICDVFPTIMELIAPDLDRSSLDGVSLLHPTEGRAIIIEDHASFAPSIGGSPSLWAVRTETNFYFEDLEQQRLFGVIGLGSYEQISSIAPELSSYFTGLLRTYASYYVEMMKEKEILAYYERLTSSSNYYSDGTQRPSPRAVNVMALLGGIVRRLKL